MTEADEDMKTLAAGASGDDPRIGLAAVAALRRLLERIEALHVKEARARGWSWQEIADALGVTRQAVHEKHAAPRRRGRRR